MNRTALFVAALLASGSAWTAQPTYSTYANTPPYGEIVSNDAQAPVGVTGQPSPYANTPPYGEILADNLNRPGMTVVAGQPGVGDVTARRAAAARSHQHAFDNYNLNMGVLGDIGYDF